MKREDACDSIEAIEERQTRRIMAEWKLPSS
jgi:hypothetical protein